MDKRVIKYLSEIGSRGGKKSRRRLDPDTARDMVRLREARRAFKKYHAKCFWSYDPNQVITRSDISWVALELKKNGDLKTWQIGCRLCP